MKKHNLNKWLNRRQFLQGMGAALALPPLYSLFPAAANAAPIGTVKRVILIPTPYGIDPADFFPKTPAANLQTKVADPTGSDIYTTPLSAFSTTANLSTSLGALYNDPVLRAKTNLYEGLDVTNGSEIVSHTYGSLAGTAKGAVPSLDSGRGPAFGETIDNTISKSPNFYSGTAQIPVLRMSSTGGGCSWSFDRLNGVAQYKSFFMGDLEIFNKAFANVKTGQAVPTGPDPTKTYLADKLLGSLTTLENSKRISTADRSLLDRYISGVHSMQKNISSNVPVSVTCAKPNLSLQVTKEGQFWAFPGDIDGQTWGVKSSLKMLQNYNEIIVSAFLCDITRVVVWGNDIWQDTPMSDYSAAAMFHSHDDGTGGPLRTCQKHAFFLDVIAQLAKRLDATPDPLSSSGSLLDNSIIMFTSEHGGVKSHSCFSIPTLTIGSAGGYFKTGMYVDCRQRPYIKDDYHESVGRPNKQLLISIMQAMGLQPAEYMSNGDGKGFGDFEVNAINNSGWNYSKFANSHNNPLPGIKA